MRAERTWTLWAGRRVHLDVFATKQRPMAVFYVNAYCYQMTGGKYHASFALTLFGVGVALSTYCRTP
jgi:hypothetical protein